MGAAPLAAAAPPGGADRRASSGPRLLGEDVYLNLTPLLDVLSNLMFFLLATFGTSAVAVFSVTVPVQSIDAGSVSPSSAAVSVLLRIEAAALHLSCAATDKLPEELAACDRALPAIAGHPDTNGLRAALRAIKATVEGATTLVVIPAETVRYAELVAVMDAARAAPLPDGGREPLFGDQVMAPSSSVAEAPP